MQSINNSKTENNVSNVRHVAENYFDGESLTQLRHDNLKALVPEIVLCLKLENILSESILPL